jgi:hypothetical protein
VQNPGDVTFTTPGVFPVTFTCTDAAGGVDPAPATRIVTVNSPPQSQISSPPADLTIATGTGLDFVGTCTDPDNNVPLTFLWNFGGGASPGTSTQPNPQGVVFNTSGTFPVSLVCTDAFGSVVPNPATVRVTVVSAVTTARVSGGGGGGGGGGCTLRPGGQIGLTTLVDILGNMFLPVLALGIIHMLSRVNKLYRLW